MAPANKPLHLIDGFINLLPRVVYAPGVLPGQINFQSLNAAKPISNKNGAMNFLGGLQ